MPASGRFAQHDERQRVQQQHGEGAVGDRRASHAHAQPKPREQRRQIGKRLRTRDELRDRKSDVHRTERDDERRQFDARDQQAVDHAGDGRDAHAAGDRDGRMKSMLHRQHAHDNRAQRHDHAAGEVDAAGENHQRLTDGQHAHHHDLTEHQRQVGTREETRRLQRKERTGQQQPNQRTGKGQPPNDHLSPQQSPSALSAPRLGTPATLSLAISCTPVST